MYRTCIFDLDGTLMDTLESLTFSVNETLKAMRLSPITQEQCRMLVGDGARALMEKVLKEVGEQDSGLLNEAVDTFIRIFQEGCTYHVVPYEGIPDLLEALKVKGFNLAVLSNKLHRQTVCVTEKILGKNTFQWIQGQKEGIPKKPDPQAALKIAEELGSRPEETLYVGDSEVDIETGRAAGMKTIGVSWGFRGREALMAAGAPYIVDSPKEILKFIN